jgi:hypothetical protein
VITFEMILVKMVTSNFEVSPKQSTSICKG